MTRAFEARLDRLEQRMGVGMSLCVVLDSICVGSRLPSHECPRQCERKPSTASAYRVVLCGLGSGHRTNR